MTYCLYSHFTARKSKVYISLYLSKICLQRYYDYDHQLTKVKLNWEAIRREVQKFESAKKKNYRKNLPEYYFNVLFINYIGYNYKEYA